MAPFFKMFFGQLIMMGLVTWNFRMISAGNIPLVATSEAIWALSNFWYLKRVVKDESLGGYFGYSLGCIIGTTTSVWLTKLI